MHWIKTLPKGLKKGVPACCYPILLGWLLACSVSAQDQVTVLLSGPERLYQQALNAFKQKLPPTLKVTSFNASDWPNGQSSDTMVAIGAIASQRMMESASCQRCLSILLPSNTFAGLLARSPASEIKLHSASLSAIYMDQPAARQLNLATLVRPGSSSIGTLYDTHSQALVKSLASAATVNGIKFHAHQLQENDNPVALLRDMYANIDIFVTVPGRYIFNQSTAKWMLYLSYRNRKPLLGFSDDYVKAGALAAVYSTPEHIAHQAAEWINALDNDGHPLSLPMPPPSFPKNFTVSVNREIARRMQVDLPSEETLISTLKNMESRP